MNDNTKDKKEKNQHSPYGAVVDLRADLPGPIKLGKKSAAVTPRGKLIGLVGGLIVLAVVISMAVFAAMRPDNLAEKDESKNILGELPFAGNRELLAPVSNASGLSGVVCEHPQRRPIGVMLAGDPINRPMSGFSQADMVWELPVLVSNVTRLLAVYQCSEPTEIGSVRSVRHDYLFLAAGIDAIVAHWGGSYHALNRIDVGEFQTLNAIVNPSNAFFRKNNLPAPYNGFTNYANLWQALQDKGYRVETNFKGYEFKDDIEQVMRPAGGTLSISWPGAFRVIYEYNPATNRYERHWAGVKQIDAADQQLVAPSSVVIMRATNEFADGPGGYNDVSVRGSGKIEVYQDGQVILGTWSKSKTQFDDPVKFLNEQGEPVEFVRGQIWVMTPSDDIAVAWEPRAL